MTSIQNLWWYSTEFPTQLQDPGGTLGLIVETCLGCGDVKILPMEDNLGMT